MNNKTIKFIQSLSRKKERDEAGVFVAEGPKIVNELLNAPHLELIDLYGVESWITNYTLPPGVSYTQVDAVMLERMSSLSTPNQVIGIFRKPKQPELSLKQTISIFADGIQDPGNMGSIVRCADWFGITQVICSYDCADIFNPKTVQSTMGSIARVHVYYHDLAALLRANADISVYAATLSGQDINNFHPIAEGVIVIGNESKGISNEILELSSDKITIPRKGNAESLNAAVATGIILSRLVD